MYKCIICICININNNVIFAWIIAEYRGLLFIFNGLRQKAGGVQYKPLKYNNLQKQILLKNDKNSKRMY